MRDRERETDLCIVLNEDEEDNILPQVLDGQVEREVCVRLEHVIQQGGAQFGKVTRVEVALVCVCACLDGRYSA